LEKDFFDEDRVKATYYPEMVKLLKDVYVLLSKDHQMIPG